MADRIQQRRDTRARWEEFNPLLLEGEVGYVTDDPNLYKIGDGINRWNSLPYRGFDGTITQETGKSENAVMSQKSVSEKLSELASEIGNIESNFEMKSLNWECIANNISIKSGESFVISVKSNIEWNRIIISCNGSTENRLIDQTLRKNNDVFEFVAPYDINSLLSTVIADEIINVNFVLTCKLNLDVKNIKKQIADIPLIHTQIKQATLFKDRINTIIIKQNNIFDCEIESIDWFPGIKHIDYPYYNILGAIIGSDLTSSSSYNVTHLMDIIANSEYISNLDLRRISFFDKDFNFIENGSYNDNVTKNSIFYSPIGAKYMRACISVNNWKYINELVINKGNSVSQDKMPYRLSNSVLINNNNIGNTLHGKTIYNFGDSIAAGDGNNGVGYSELLALKYGCKVIDYAVGGSTMSRIEGQSMQSILSHIENASEEEPDVILLEGGANDYSQNRILGNMTQYRYYEVIQWDFDETTYIGATEKAFNMLRTKYPNTPILYIFVHQQNSRDKKIVNDNEINFYTMHDKVVEVCKKWAIKVCDIFTEGGMNTCITYHREHFTNNADGTHPNEKGYEKFYIPMIVEKIKEII